MSSSKNLTESPTNHTLYQDWIIHVKQTLEEGAEDDFDGVPVSIFSVPKALSSIKKEAYVPQQVALGPYHHRRLELFEMEAYKLICARRIQKKLSIRFCDLVEQFKESEGSIRACYCGYLDYDHDELAWIFVIDASFLLEFLQTYIPKNVTSPSLRASSSLSHFIDYTRRKSAYNMILRDVVMMENQIPLFVLREVNRYSHEYENPDGVLAMMLIHFCKHLCPIKISKNDDEYFFEECFRKAHLLDLLYNMAAPKVHAATEIEELKEAEDQDDQDMKSPCMKGLKSVVSFLCFISFAPILFIKRILKSRRFLLVLTIPWTILKFVFHSETKNAVANVLMSAKNMAEDMESVCDNEMKDASPLVEELSVPSVTKLASIGVKFIPTKGGLGTIRFDKSYGAFYLPILDLDDNSEVVLRNLVAYEGSIGPEGMVLTRYVQLMNGIIDTDEDVRLLRKAGIIFNHLKSDEEAATLCNGMTKFVKLTKVPKLDKAIEGANTYYSQNWRVRTRKILKKYVYSSWPFLTFLAANVLILLSVLEALCSVDDCSKWISKAHGINVN